MKAGFDEVPFLSIWNSLQEYKFAIRLVECKADVSFPHLSFFPFRGSKSCGGVNIKKRLRWSFLSQDGVLFNMTSFPFFPLFFSFGRGREKFLEIDSFPVKHTSLVFSPTFFRELTQSFFSCSLQCKN